MKRLDELIEALQEEPLVKEFKELEQTIMEREDLKERFEELLAEQRRYVRAKTFGRDRAKDAEEAYLRAREELEDIPLVRQYLNLQEMLKEELGLLFRLIEDALNEPFDTDL